MLFQREGVQELRGKATCLVYFLQQLVQFRTRVTNAQTQFMFSCTGQSPRD